MNVAIAAVLGVMIGLFVVFLIEYLDNKIKTPQDIEKYLGLPILGVIPNEKLVK
jgi:capsular polysaccharide biosynthesis protein